MTLLIVGTYPQGGGPLLTGEATVDAEKGVSVEGRPLSYVQGIAPLLAAACQVSLHLHTENPYVLLGGDIGRGDGTRDIFQDLRGELERLRPDVIAFHYMQPVMSLMREAVATIDEVVPEAMLVADAGGMYAVKPAGLSSRFELMTPDVGELGFLADEEVHHPAYVSRYLFGNEGFDAEALAVRAFETGGASRVLLVKGAQDYIVAEGKVIKTISQPSIPELEAIGGTGDTITGLACGFLAAGFSTVDAAICACRANRAAGERTEVTPATHVRELVAQIPAVLEENLCNWAQCCPA